MTDPEPRPISELPAVPSPHEGAAAPPPPPAPAGSGGFLQALQAGVTRAREVVTELGADERLAPVREVLHSGAASVSAAVEKTADTVTQQSTWDEHHALLEDLVDVVAYQQGLLEDLRIRIARLENR